MIRKLPAKNGWARVVVLWFGVEKRQSSLSIYNVAPNLCPLKAFTNNINLNPLVGTAPTSVSPRDRSIFQRPRRARKKESVLGETVSSES
jgi:hypothetical protein